ncbi:GPCR fungal pheromone mating factor [Nemania sp. FL0916]|nr:GPCR fungal pheromone mating factor [Nemania sp. FL0916]
MEQSIPGLAANCVTRVIFAFLSILINWVPFRLLLRNGEFAAVVFIVDVAILNFFTIINSLIWHDDNWEMWWDGTGLCDVEVYLFVPLQTVYAASIFTIIYRLAEQVKATRVGQVRGEKTRRNIRQAAIIFTIPVIQLIWTYFDLAQRYIIGTLIGCSAIYDSSWPKNVFFDAPPAVFAVFSVPYAILIWWRYRKIAKQSREFMISGTEVSIRAARTRRRLYNMTLSILVVYLPVMIYYLVFSVRDTSGTHPYNFRKLHDSANPYPWDAILFVPSWIIPTTVMNQPWVVIATSVAIVFFFGTTAEAKQMYMEYAENIGLAGCLQILKWKRGKSTSPADDSADTHESGRTLVPNRVRGPIADQ